MDDYRCYPKCTYYVDKSGKRQCIEQCNGTATETEFGNECAPTCAPGYTWNSGECRCNIFSFTSGECVAFCSDYTFYNESSGRTYCVDSCATVGLDYYSQDR